MDALASRYSSGVSAAFSSAYSAAHASFLSSNAAGMPPHPTNRDKVSCSSVVARRFSCSSVFSRRIASMLARNFCFGPPAPKSSSVIWKFIFSLRSSPGDGSPVPASFLACPEACRVVPFPVLPAPSIPSTATGSKGNLRSFRIWLISSGFITWFVRGLISFPNAACSLAAIRSITSAINCICSGGNSGFSIGTRFKPFSAAS